MDQKLLLVSIFLLLNQIYNLNFFSIYVETNDLASSKFHRRKQSEAVSMKPAMHLTPLPAGPGYVTKQLGLGKHTSPKHGRSSG